MKINFCTLALLVLASSLGICCSAGFCLPASSSSVDDAKFRMEQQQRYLAMLQSKDKRAFAVTELLSDYPLPAQQAIPLFSSLLSPENASDFDFSALLVKALSTYGPDAKSAVPRLLQILRSPDRSSAYGFVKTEAVQAIAIIDPKERSFVPAMLDCLQSQPVNNYLRLAIFKALDEQGRAASIAIPALSQQVKKSPFGDEQFAAFVALGHIHGKLGDLPTEELAAKLQGASLPESAAAFIALVSQGRKASKVAPMLTSLLREQHEQYLQLAAIVALGAVGPGQTAEATKVLLDKLADGDPDVSTAVEGALAQLLPTDTQAITPLINALRMGAGSRLERMRRLEADAASALIHFGPAAAPAVPTLITLVQSSSANADTSLALYARVLSSIGPAANDSNEILGLQLLRLFKADPVQREDQLILSLFIAMESLGIKPQSLPAVQEGLNSSNMSVFSAAARASGELGAVASPVVPLLIQGLAHPSGNTALSRKTLDQSGGEIFAAGFAPWTQTTMRLEIVLALGKIGAGAKSAIPALRQIADAPNEAALGKDALGKELIVTARQALIKINAATGVTEPPSL